MPLGVLAFLLVGRALPAEDIPPATPAHGGFGFAGTVLLSIRFGTYALAMTIGRGHFGPLKFALLLPAFGACGFFLLVEAKAADPLIR